MIKQITRIYNYKNEHSAFISSLGRLQGHEWDKPSRGFAPRSRESVRRNSGIKELKKFIKEKLNVSHKQGRGDNTGVHCAFCGLKMEVTSNKQIEHFIPKTHQPEYMFKLVNLLLACQLCNGPQGKGTKDVVESKGASYRKYKFKIVHPRIHNPGYHIKYKGKNKIVICKAKCTDKGKLSVEWFKLDKKEKTLARAAEQQQAAIKINWKSGAVSFDKSLSKKHFT